MNLIDTLLGIGLGLSLGFFIHGLLYVIAERQHQEDRDDAWQDGRRAGYDQCHKEMVLPLKNVRRTPPARCNTTESPVNSHAR